MAATLGIPELTLSIIIGALIAIIFSLRVLYGVDRRIERIEEHIEKIANKIVREELKIERMIKNKRRR